MDRIIPMASVDANPFTVPEPLQNRTAAAISVVTFPVHDGGKNFLEAVLDRCLHRFSCSDLLLDSRKDDDVGIHSHTDDRMIPATPGRVRVTLKDTRE